MTNYSGFAKSGRFGLAATIFLSLSMGIASAQETLYRWQAGSAEQQLAADTTVVPRGQGAIFLPALTRGDDEPPVLVESGDRQVADSRMGQRIVLDPGHYTVRVGSGAITQTMTVDVEVLAGDTLIIEPNWSGLVVEVVDENNIPFNGTYELIRTEDRELMGLGFGVDTLQGETLQTWLLRPGPYRIVRPGSTYRARRDFASVYLPTGGLAHFKLVLDRSSGDYRGGGAIDMTELAVPATGTSNWARTTTVGLGIPFSRTSNVVGASNQTTVGIDVVADTYATYTNGPHSFVGIAEVEAGFVKIDPSVGNALPSQKTRDRFRIDGVYTYYSSPRFGPYVRIGLLTSVFESNVLATEPTIFQRHFLDGTLSTETVPANRQFRVADPFSPLSFREGLGVNYRLVREQAATVNWRLGFGFRQNAFSDTFVELPLQFPA